ncbi:hypothetical protein AruPA_10595, partial [Acidiphilium sp. PA]|uniref:hypothetical protein n=1 Tax=Acidiphilium sp. PA TaxID=2871705 RepID=UPI0022442AB1
YVAAPSGQDGPDPTPAVLPWVATQGRTFLVEHRQYIRIRYYKDGQSPCEAHRSQHHNRPIRPFNHHHEINPASPITPNIRHHQTPQPKI